MADSFQLKAIITAVDKVSAPLKGMQRQLKGFKKEFASLSLGAAGAGTAVLGALALPVKSAIALESKMADVRKVVDGLDTPEAFKAMTEQVRDLSTELPMSAEGIAEIVAAGGQAGIARDELMQFTDDAVKMGVAFDTTAEESGQMMAQWRTAFKLTQGEVAGLADKINYLGNTGPASAKKISDIVTRIGPLGSVAGVASGEIAAMGATIAGMGVESEIAATGIKNFMLSLTAGNSATKSQKKVLRSLRISPKKLAADMQKDARGAMLHVLDSLAKVPKEKQAAALNELFGKGSSESIAPLLTNLDLLRTNFNRVADAQQYGGSMQKEYAARAATTENQLLLLQNQINAISSTLGETFLPSINEGIKEMKPFLEEVRTFVRENPEVVKTIAKTGAALLTMGVAIGTLTRITKIMGSVMNMTPAKGLIALLVGGAYLIIDNWETVGPVIKNVWEVIDGTAQAMGGWETILKAIAIFMATKWVTDVTKSISIVTKDMRTLGKVTAATGLFGKGGGVIGKAGVYGMLASMMWEPVENALESILPEGDVNWARDHGIYLASDWTPFFNRKNYEEYQASLNQPRQYKPNVPLLNPAISSVAARGEIKVTFDNAPQGMRVIDLPKTGDPFMKITHDVGYSPFRR
ncbi:phage tail tape measure protein [Shigella flexneri]|uniref:phage tail tape measure protein n=1 Tax=Escherichia coli TaxID=562 RepID=UPI00093C4FFB|nr:phage tail tape measure protein [Escherichia coli]EIZ2961240.1 phage tail tape measure protein [Shigella flexneri]EFF0550039.1 phage tail tape measure protein [Escherichia coli]EFK6671956.1 phage tail tape measure protein [Escherichia coli]ELG9830867.1 phage tail tape measure protein [Shigella flexneri]HDQ5866747.1 phage tail tape measure protein [Shigella flexneri]